MTQPAQPIEADAFYASLLDRTAQGISTIALDGGELPVSVQLRDSTSLVFTFSGAVDRTQQALPRFSAASLFDYVPASIIGLADPTLTRSDDLTLAWYAGNDGFELQKILPGVLQEMIDSLGATRVVFVGSSGGGFAALYYSWHIPGSVAVVSNPQTNLDAYIRAHRRRYVLACWPGHNKDTPLRTFIDADLAPLYAERHNNTVVYLQVASDFFHITQHFAPFASVLPRECEDRFIVRMDNWGDRGHHPVPSSIWVPWMNAALAAPGTTGAAIEETWSAANPSELPRLTPLPGDERTVRLRPTKPAVHIDSRDGQIAAELARAATSATIGEPASQRSST